MAQSSAEWHIFAKEFLKAREAAIKASDLDGFIYIYQWLYDNVLSTAPKLFDIAEGEREEFRAAFLSYAENIGKKIIQEVAELQVLFDKK